MDDPGWSWPAWKFGMKRDDLFTKLHDQYNTFTFTIQDPEAFHHDVYELSRDADTAEEFHRLMAGRQSQRLQELHESLESLAVEIIANPKLMDSEHWQYALQLFRTKSFDSIVRYFASYLPDSYLDRHDAVSVTSSSFSETNSVKSESTSASSVDDAHISSFFGDEAIMTKEPLSIHTHDLPDIVEGPLSPPESEAMHPESSASSPIDVESHRFTSNPPSRSMSFSGSETGPFGANLSRPHPCDDDETSQSESGDSAVASVTDSAETPSSLDSLGEDEDEDVEDEFPTAQFPEDSFEAFESFDGVSNDTLDSDTLDSDTPTPRQETVASCYVDYKSVLAKRLPSPHRRSPSPSPKHRLAGRRDLKETRRSPDEALSKVMKTSLEPTRKRPMARRRLD